MARDARESLTDAFEDRIEPRAAPRSAKAGDYDEGIRLAIDSASIDVETFDSVAHVLSVLSRDRARTVATSAAAALGALSRLDPSAARRPSAAHVERALRAYC